jgi:hypothetical protein
MKAYHRFRVVGSLVAVALVACSEASVGPPHDASVVVDLDGNLSSVRTGGLRRASGGRAALALTPDEVAALPPLTGISMAYDKSHNGNGRQGITSPDEGNANSTIFGDLTTRGATIQVITSFNAELLAGFDVVWLEEGTALSEDDQTVLANYVAEGGAAIVYGDQWSTPSPLQVFGFGYAGGAFNGIATNITQHPVTEGVKSLQFTAVQALSTAEGSTTLVTSPDGRALVGFTDVGAGRVVVITDEICSNEENGGDVASEDNELLCNNLVTYASGRESETTETVDGGEAAIITVKEDTDGDGDVEAVAGVDFPEDAFQDDPNDPNDDAITVTVKLRKVQPGDPACHAFLIGQIGRCMEITAKKQDGVTDAPLVKPIRVGMCLDEHHAVDIYKSETSTSEAKPLRQTDVSDFLDCTDFHLSGAPPKNWLHGLAMRVGKWVTPKSAWAADRGMGGISDDGRLSIFTWAAPVQVSHASLLINVRDRGNDFFEVTGVFDLVAQKGFEPAATESGFNPALPIPIRYGASAFTIPGGGLRWNQRINRYVYARLALTGITTMVLDPATGKFTVGGIVPTEGDAIPAYRPFTIQFGNRLTGAGLECGESTVYVCTFEQHE